MNTMNQESIGSYRILEKKGEGGMAQVYLAVHKDVPNLKVILKVLSDPRLGERFKQEADKLALLDGHPCICRIKHFFSHGDEIVIAMEYIDGVSLEDKIKSISRFEVGEAAQVADDVLDIHAFAHQKDIYHRDIKPGNIMIDKSGQTKVIDFGIAKGKADPNLTVAGTACGTPAYMAPEQFNPTEKADYALWDIYAVGTTLYMMLCGEVPFTDENPFAIRDAKLFNEPPSPRLLNPTIPKPLEEVILKSLARDPDQRYQTAEQMQDALSPFLSAAPSQHRTPPGDMTVKLTTPKPIKSKKPLLMAGIIVGFLALLVATYQFIIKDDSTRGSDGAIDTTLNVGDPSLSLVPPTGILEVSIQPKGDIYLDNSLLKAETDAWMVDIDTGQHIVRVENSKSTTPIKADTFYLMADSTEHLDFVFTMPQPKPKPPPPEKKVEVVIASIPLGSTVFIDGKQQAKGTPYTYPMKKGEHRIRLEHGSGADKLERDTTINAIGDTLRVFLNLNN